MGDSRRAAVRAAERTKLYIVRHIGRVTYRGNSDFVKVNYKVQVGPATTSLQNRAETGQIKKRKTGDYAPFTALELCTELSVVGRARTRAAAGAPAEVAGEPCGRVVAFETDGGSGDAGGAVYDG